MAEEAEPTLSKHIGRYEILGFLASGGMAEILLGCLRGAMGVDRPVVIKRILPHLARQRAFVDMFLDEARIVASIRHVNVVDVLELGHENGELFLVMEYLEGESVGGLCRRLLAQQQRMDPGLAAYVLAQACAGLNAAHELTDAQGQNRGLVHRDVSPQNIFITYRGRVAVLDFGIATSADRVARTEAGVLKGKLEYMSPEQCRGKRLDRRADIFALGTVLYELSTGRRLFKRPGQMLVFKAICEEPIVPPGELVDGYPKPLERVVMRALARRKEDRYQTAGEMRRDLTAVLRQLDVDAPEEDLARLMVRLFDDRIQEKTEMLSSVGSRSAISRIVTADADTLVELPSVDGTATQTSSVMDSVGGRKTRPLAGAALASVLICGAIGAAYTWRRLHVPTTQGLSVDAPHSALPATSSPPAVAATASARTISLYVESTAGARAFIDGRDIGLTPAEVRIPAGEDPVLLELHKDGYAPLVERVVPNVDQRLRLPLSAAPHSPRPARQQSPSSTSTTSVPAGPATSASTTFRPW